MAEKQKERMQRVQFEFSLDALQQLDDIKEKTGASTRAEVVRNALSLYDWLVNDVDPNNTIKVFDDNNDIVALIKAKRFINGF
jgi:metal-responsive CopG/Arc/MetJ family transcriptional regulator